ncbi:hypothetical protein LINPERPRIM_LOCUS22661, partial [Linum perenne]
MVVFIKKKKWRHGDIEIIEPKKRFTNIAASLTYWSDEEIRRLERRFTDTCNKFMIVDSRRREEHVGMVMGKIKRKKKKKRLFLKNRFGISLSFSYISKLIL